MGSGQQGPGERQVMADIGYRDSAGARGVDPGPVF